MALRKNIRLPNGAGGDYIRLTFYRWDRAAREASAHFMLYASVAQANAAPNAPLCLIAKLRLAGLKFDEYLANAVLTDNRSVVAQLYRAAKTEPLVVGGGLTQTELSLSDAADD